MIKYIEHESKNPSANDILVTYLRKMGITYTKINYSHRALETWRFTVICNVNGDEIMMHFKVSEKDRNVEQIYK